MSYARFGKDSDVYIYQHINGKLTCCSCKLPEYNETKIRLRWFRWYFARWIVDIVGFFTSILAVLSLGFYREFERKLFFINRGMGLELWLLFNWEWARSPNQHTDFECVTRPQMLKHIIEHKKAGHKVPHHTTKRLKKEINEILGDTVEDYYYYDTDGD